MNISNKGLQILKYYEGLRLKSYDDGVGVQTIGYGTTKIKGVKVKPGLVISNEQAEEYLKADLRVFEKAVEDAVTVDLSQEQFDSLVVFTYNVGIGAFKGSTLLKLLNQGKYSDVPAQLLRWSKAGGKTMAGLVKRRQSEGHLFSKGIVKLF